MGNRLGVLGLGALLWLAACGGSTEDGGSGGTAAVGGSGAMAGSGAVAGTAGAGGVAGAGAGGSGGVAGSGAGGSAGAADPGTPGLAFEKLFLGDTDRAFVPSSTAWRQYGRNVDGLVTTAASTDVCQLQPGASPSSVKPDGDAGIDNSFGANVVPLIGALAADPSLAMTQSIASGQFTLLLDFGDPFAPADQVGVATGVFSGGTLQSPPLWNGSDVWPVTHASTLNGDKSQPKAKFSAGTIAGGVWTSEAAGTLTFELGVAGFSLALEISKVQLSAKLDGSGATLAGSDGVVSGVVDTEKLILELKKVAGSFDPSLCNGATFESIAQQIRAASDILLDGSQNPSQTCNAISIGIGFEASAARIGAVDPPLPPPPNPCGN